MHYLRWTRSFARKIWITYKLAHMTYHQNSSNQPDDPMGSTEPPRTPKDPPSTSFGPLNIPLDPIGPLIYHLNCLTNNLMTHQLLLFILWVTLDITLDSLGSSNVLLTPPLIPWYP